MPERLRAAVLRPSETGAARRRVALLCALVLAFSGCISLEPFPTPDSATVGENKGQRFPNLTFKDENGNARQLWDYRGNVVFLNFWASWCDPCRREFGGIQALYQALGREGVAFLLLNAWEPFDTGKAWAKAASYAIPLCDSTERGNGVLPLATGGVLRVPRIPRTYILDHNGIVVHAELETNLFWNQFEKPLRELIRAAPPQPGKKQTFVVEGARVEAELMEGQSRATLTLQIAPRDGLQLVAKRGIKISATEPARVTWITPMPVLRQEDADYFPGPQAFLLSFVPGTDSHNIGLRIEYAYCRPNTECILAETTISVPR